MLELASVSVSIAGVPVLRQVSLNVPAGARVPEYGVDHRARPPS